MSHKPKPRTVQVPNELLELTREILQRQGVRRASKTLGVGRTALFGLIATGVALPGTLALLRESLGRLDGNS